MKKISLALCILLLFVLIFTLSACKKDGYDWHITYNSMCFELIPQKTENGKDYYYIAGDLEDKTVKNYFIPMLVNGFPVRAFGWGGFASRSHTKLEHFSLQKLYMPGTIVEHYSQSQYFSDLNCNLQVYYCGEVIDLYKMCPIDLESYVVNYYVPVNKLSSFQKVFNNGIATTCGLYKANISYRLNSEDMCEYYYVDNIESGSKIQNIPPEPTRAGYTFGGWYTEKECTIKWDFDNVPTVSNNDDSFVEFALYAKWTKK
ncbi:MAG: InlB B-repeat-containing protein [Clostridiales bacterium]|nr:InlB B-repeat-containing protein [Clostridiales bacterium]